MSGRVIRGVPVRPGVVLRYVMVSRTRLLFVYDFCLN